MANTKYNKIIEFLEHEISLKGKVYWNSENNFWNSIQYKICGFSGF
jgi:hypothetical protein